jgi:DNA polymerase III subunit gamma/tau
MVMQTTSLAVLYRPKSFADYVGQASVASRLVGMAKKGRMPPSLLITGVTGTGKTTLARMIAQFLNCKNPNVDTFETCGDCPSCRMGESHPDIVELNAADSRGIDDVRAMLAHAANMPTIGNKKVFIWDECQMLTPQAQAAILTSAESPSPHTVWIFASMNPEKLNAALRGRCFKIELKPVDQSECAARLYAIARKEGVRFKDIEGGEKILKSIASASCGRMRDAVQMLEQVLYAVRADDKVDYKEILSSVFAGGEIEQEKYAADILKALLTQDGSAFLSAAYSLDGNYRQVMLKIRWLIDYLLADHVGKAKFAPYAGKIFKKIYPGEIDISFLLYLQGITADIEVAMNSNADEKAIFISKFGGAKK